MESEWSQNMAQWGGLTGINVESVAEKRAGTKSAVVAARFSVGHTENDQAVVRGVHVLITLGEHFKADGLFAPVIVPLERALRADQTVQVRTVDRAGQVNALSPVHFHHLVLDAVATDAGGRVHDVLH